jgi:hypothetical protein
MHTTFLNDIIQEVRNFIWELCHLSVESGCPSIGVDFRDYLDVEVINAVGWNVLEPEAPGSKAPAGPCHSPVSRTESPKAASFTRSFEEMGVLIEENKTALLSDEELVEMCIRGKVAGYSLEKTLESQSTPAMTRLEAFTRAVKIRRAVVARMPSTLDVSSSLEQARLSYQNYNYELVYGTCCENVFISFMLITAATGRHQSRFRLRFREHPSQGLLYPGGSGTYQASGCY